MDELELQQAVALEAGAYAVAVSGGADSVALLLLLSRRPSLHLHVVHLDHQTRGQASTDDASFVAALAARLELPVTIARRDEIEKDMAKTPANPSARYRQARLELFRQVVGRHGLSGVVLGHHADDQAETIFQRLLRGSTIRALGGMKAVSRLGNLSLFRPLLEVGRDDLRAYLNSLGQSWREDASNQADDYMRNRLRKVLTARPRLTRALLSLGLAARKYGQWIEASSPRLGKSFAVGELSSLPAPLGRQSARQWLLDNGAPAERLTIATLDRLVEMARDAASGSREDFPGGLRVQRRAGRIIHGSKEPLGPSLRPGGAG